MKFQNITQFGMDTIDGWNGCGGRTFRPWARVNQRGNKWRSPSSRKDRVFSKILFLMGGMMKRPYIFCAGVSLFVGLLGACSRVPGSPVQKTPIAPPSETPGISDNEEIISESGQVLEIAGRALSMEYVLSLNLMVVTATQAPDDAEIVLAAIDDYVAKKFPHVSEYSLYAFYEYQNYYLLFLAEPNVADGGLELVYKISTQKIIGYFMAGYKG